MLLVSLLGFGFIFFLLFQMPELDILAAKMNAEFEEAESFELVVE